MTRMLTWLTCAATCLLANSARADRYIVQLEGAPAADAYQRIGLDAAIDRLAHAHGASVEHRFGAALRGFTAEMTPAQAAALLNDPSVESVSEDAIVRADGAVQ